MAERIEAVTLDLWDTMIADQTDEPKREARGLRRKTDEHRHLIHRALVRHGAIPPDVVAAAYDVTDVVFKKVWHDHHVTWTMPERLKVLLAGLGRELPGDEFDGLVMRLETMEFDVPPDAVPGIADALAALHESYKLCVVSDALVTPGRVLRELLGHYGLDRFFSAFVFSDEVGCSKPDPRMFHLAAERLGVDLGAMVHIGDREDTDIKGAHAVGMKAVLFTAVRRADESTTGADAVCRRAADLPAVVDRLAGAQAARARLS